MGGAHQPVPTEAVERELRLAGCRVVAGLDEVGRGAWAGPLVMGAVILPDDVVIDGLRDSKLLTATRREVIAEQIKAQAISVGLGLVSVDELNEFGLAAGLQLAAVRAVKALTVVPDMVLVDGSYPFRALRVPQRATVRGDQTIRTIAAASVIAKVARDAMMREIHELDQSAQAYRFDLNKGYPSPVHQAELKNLGPCDHHRTCFAPIAALLKESDTRDVLRS